MVAGLISWSTVWWWVEWTTTVARDLFYWGSEVRGLGDVGQWCNSVRVPPYFDKGGPTPLLFVGHVINRKVKFVSFYRSEAKYYGIRTSYVVFSYWAETFFRAFHTSWTTKWPIAHISVILSSCHSVIVILWLCDRLVVSSFLCLNIFQSAPKLVQKFFNAILREIL